MQNDIYNELATNFIEYAVAVNEDRAIPNAVDGLKPVAKRIIYDAFIEGFLNNKPHVKCANIVGTTMSSFHPHGDSSIYGALVRLSQDWVMRYPLIDFHGSNGNRDGDGPAAYRYTEARLNKLTEDGMLFGIKKNNVDFVDNFSETLKEPISLPAIFPNLLCNPNTGIGVALACNWLPHNLREVKQAIFDYLNGIEPMLPGPDFPTGGLIINGKDIPNIMATGHGSIKLRGKYNIEKNNIVFYEIPYGIQTEALLTQIGEAADSGKIEGISHIRNESNKKGFRLVIECDKTAIISNVIRDLFKETDLQTSISYNQVALINRVPTELNLKDCIKVYIDYNKECIIREINFDKEKTEHKIHINEGILKALEDIDNIIALIKTSESSSDAKEKLMTKYGFSEIQAQAILDIKLSRLAHLEKIEIENELQELKKLLSELFEMLSNPEAVIRSRLDDIANRFGDVRRTEITNIVEEKEKEEKEIIPEDCYVAINGAGMIKRTSTMPIQKKVVKTKAEIITHCIKTNTADNLLIFSNLGLAYKVLVNDINDSGYKDVRESLKLASNERVAAVIPFTETPENKYIVFATSDGTVKKTSLAEFADMKKKTGVKAISLKEGSTIIGAEIIEKEQIMLFTKLGMCIRFNSTDISPTGKVTIGTKSISLSIKDEVVQMIVIRDSDDYLIVFSNNGKGKRTKLSEYSLSTKGCRGSKCIDNFEYAIIGAEETNLVIFGKRLSTTIQTSAIPEYGKTAIGNIILKESVLEAYNLRRG